MRASVAVALTIGVMLGGCTRETLTVAPEQATSPSEGEAKPSEANPGAALQAQPEPAPLLPGSFASAPLTDWPCSATMDLQDGGGTQNVQFTYDRRQSCAIPGELVSQGIVGCPTTMVVRRPGDPEPLYVQRYEYDEDGLLVALIEDDNEPETFSYDRMIVHDRGIEVLTYTGGDPGFVVADTDGRRMEGTVSQGRLIHLHKMYPRVKLELEVKLEWDGDRLMSMDSGGDQVTFDYSCRDANRT